MPELFEKIKFKLEDIQVTEEEVFRVLKTMETCKVNGTEKINPHMVNHCAHELTIPLTKLFPNYTSHKKYPKQWKKTNVVQIHKKK